MPGDWENVFIVTRVRAVAKISSCWGNTLSRWGIKQLGISFGSNYLLFSYESSWGVHLHITWRKSLAPCLNDSHVCTLQIYKSIIILHYLSVTRAKNIIHYTRVFIRINWFQLIKRFHKIVLLFIQNISQFLIGLNPSA